MTLERPRRSLPTQQVWLPKFAVSALDPVRNYKTVFVFIMCILVICSGIVFILFGAVPISLLVVGELLKSHHRKFSCTLNYFVKYH